jgi:hypothetical protein
MPPKKSDMDPDSNQSLDTWPIVAMAPNFEAISAEDLLGHEVGQPHTPSQELPDSRKATLDQEHGAGGQEQKYWRDWRRVTEEPPG